MALPRQTSGLNPPASGLGLGDLLTQQVSGETEEMRKKRMLQQQQQQSGMGLPPASALFPGGFGV